MLSLCTGFLKFENCLSIMGNRTKTEGGARTSPHPVYSCKKQKKLTHKFPVLLLLPLLRFPPHMALFLALNEGTAVDAGVKGRGEAVGEKTGGVLLCKKKR